MKFCRNFADNLENVEIFEFSSENSYFERVRMVRMVRSLADRTFQPRREGQGPHDAARDAAGHAAGDAAEHAAGDEGGHATGYVCPNSEFERFF